MMKTKTIALIAVIGLACLGFSLIGTPFLESYTLANAKGMTMTDDSETNVTKCYTVPFHIDRQKKCTINLFVQYNDTSDDNLTLMFLGRETYIANMEVDPSTLAGSARGLVYTRTQYPAAAVSAGQMGAYLGILKGYSYLIVFMGSTIATTPISIPGDYVALIWVEDPSTPDGGNLIFDLTVKVEGLGEVLRLIFNIAGGSLLGVAAILYLRQKKR